VASLQSLLDAKDKQLQEQMKRGAQNSSDIGRANFRFLLFNRQAVTVGFPFKVALHGTRLFCFNLNFQKKPIK